VVVEKTSARVIDKNTKILEKAQVRKESTNKGEGTSKLSFLLLSHLLLNIL
jgi:hypothetical protein